MAVLRPGRGFRVILHREDRLVFQRNAAICAVKQADMGFLYRLGQAVAVNREAVIHRGDFHLAGGQIFHRMIGPVMALLHFDGLRTKRTRQHLMAKTNAENRLAAGYQCLDFTDRIIAGRRRITRPVGQKNTVR